MDWADEVAENLRDETDELLPFVCLAPVARALRKAKADGMREAAASTNNIKFWRKKGNGVHFFNEPAFKEHWESRASAIEKGME